MMNYKNEGPVEELHFSISIEIRIKKGNNRCEDVIAISKGGGAVITSAALTVKPDSTQVSRLCI